MNKGATQITFDSGQRYPQLIRNGLLGHTFKTIEQKGPFDPRRQPLKHAINSFNRLANQRNVFGRGCIGQMQIGQLIQIGLLKLAAAPQRAQQPAGNGAQYALGSWMRSNCWAS